ncbi:MAG: hypothetical protein R3E32_28305 [Chitinophagales bacterium]
MKLNKKENWLEQCVAVNSWQRLNAQANATASYCGYTHVSLHQKRKKQEMKTFIAEIIPKIQEYSEKLDNLTMLANQHWVVFDDIDSEKNVYIFRSNNQLLISKNGKVEKGKWENIGNNSILIDLKNESYLFKHGFFDRNILALKLDGKNEYAFLINENKHSGELNSLNKITEFLRQNYLDKPLPREIKKSGNFKSTKGDIKVIELPMTKFETENGILYIEGAASYMDGRKVYKNLEKEPASEGKYKVGFMWYIHIKNGKVFKTTIL